ncbi:hypothetical protein Lokhon_03012 [Limimaricola hongkongensis DSM 17492]|uniref:Uncharacterized protein n=1 Tax=Limimaricola hongkongensis DSM 17492 TaxID=1122180 RepID=A0A017HC45_9RHOB|nr:YihY/virulence factor BrkB family protein [Limimaricola hongkongensis]EYD71364.1 hypothetical protein Lokhon_03012 [Limimaricola hongkongensis DSM 17492]
MSRSTRFFTLPRLLWRLLIGLWTLSGEVQLGLVAAGVAFYSVFAIFPAIAALIAIFGLVADPEVIKAQLELMREIIPVEAYGLLTEQLNLMVSTRPETLGFATVMSTFVALFSARNGVASLILGLNQIYGRPNRNGVWQLLVAMLLTFSLIAIAVLAMLVVVVAPILLAVLPLGSGTGWALEAVRWIAAFGIVLAGLGVLYRFGPNMRGARGRWITPGAFLVILFWLLASAGFSYYLSNFGNYNEVYGSIGAVVALLMWLFISAWLVLLGAAINVVWARIVRSGTGISQGAIHPGPRPREIG